MAIFKPGFAIAGLSGTHAAVVFKNARGSKVLARAPSFAKASSENHMLRQAGLAHYAKSWSTLTDEQRLEWRTLARTVPFVNALGEQRPLTGFQLFLRHHLPLWPRITTPLTALPLADQITDPTGSTAAFSEAGAWNITAPLPLPIVLVNRVVFISRNVTSFTDRYFANYVRGPLVAVAPATFNWRSRLEPLVGTLLEGQAVGLLLAYYDTTQLQSALVPLVLTVAA